MNYHFRRISAVFIMMITAVILLGVVSLLDPDVPAEIGIQALEQPAETSPAEKIPSDNMPAADPAVDTERIEKPTSATTMGIIPLFAGQPYAEINGSVPFFTEGELTTDAFEYYSPLDELGRCG